MNALIFDCDGVLADTERGGHLRAFNSMFREFSLPVEWSEKTYADKLRIGGGKERLATLFEDPGFVSVANIPSDSAARQELLARWHQAKTKHFTNIVERGDLPPRPGVRRLINDALSAGWIVAVASTSAESSVRSVLAGAVGQSTAARIPVFAGDVVPAKKPNPGIYELVLAELALDVRDTIVIEDSRNGLLAATSAGVSCVVTVNDYTREEQLSEAVLVVSSLGDPQGPSLEVLAAPAGVVPRHFVTLEDLQTCMPHRFQPGLHGASEGIRS